MPPVTLRNFDKEREILDQALEAGVGIEVKCETYGGAVSLRRRCNYFRKLDRDWYAQNTDPNDPHHGLSTYENLVLTIPPRGSPRDNILIIRPRKIETYTIQPLTEQSNDQDRS